MVADILRHSKHSFEGMSDPIMLFATSLLKIHKNFIKSLIFVLEQKGKVFWNIEKSTNLLSHHTLTSDKDLKILAHPYRLYSIAVTFIPYSWILS